LAGRRIRSLFQPESAILNPVWGLINFLLSGTGTIASKY